MPVLLFANRHVFTGQEIDENTGLVYFGARYYDPDTGRFINEDTYLGESLTAPSLHRYLYAYANPGVYVDLYGNKSVFGDATRTLDDFKGYLDRQNVRADNGFAAVGIRTAKFFVSSGQFLTGFLDTTANLAQVAVGVDDQQVREELASTRLAVTDGIDFIANGDKVEALKQLHGGAVNTLSYAFEGDVSAISDSSEFVAGIVAGGKTAAGGKSSIPRINRGPTVAQTVNSFGQAAKVINKTKNNIVQSLTRERAGGGLDGNQQKTKLSDVAQSEKVDSSLKGSKRPISELSDREYAQELANRAEKYGILKGYGRTGTGNRQGIKKHSYAEKLHENYQRLYGERKKLGIVYDYKFVKNPGKGIPKKQIEHNENNLPNVVEQIEVNPN